MRHPKGIKGDDRLGQQPARETLIIIIIGIQEKITKEETRFFVVVVVLFCFCFVVVFPSVFCC